MGLLDFLSSEDAQLGLGLLGAAGPRSDGAGFGQRLQEGMGYVQAQKDAKMKREFMGSQMDNYRSEIEARKLATLKDARQQELIASVFGPGGGGAMGGGMSPGAFAPSADGRGPTMPPQMQAQSGGLANMTPDMVARLKLGGLDLTDIYKFSQEPQKYEPGSTYKNRNDGTERFIPKVGEGIAPDKHGFYNEVPGYGAAQAGIEGAKTLAQERAKAGLDPVKVYNPATGRDEYTTRSAVVGGQAGGLPDSASAPGSWQQANPGQNLLTARPGESDKGQIYASALTQAQQQLMQARTPEEKARAQSDIAGIQGEMRKANIPAPSSPPLRAGGNFAAGPSADEAAANAAKVTQANANVKPLEGRNNALAQTSNMMKSIDGLMNHPGLSTGTGLSGTMDPRNYIPGTDAKNFGVALDQIKGGTFLQAFESLKSGGAVSEIEGTKATNAIARLNTAQSTTEFQAALTDFKEVMTGVQARQKAAMPGGSPTPEPDKPKPSGTAFDAKPPAQNYKGRSITGPDGTRYQSDGMIWKAVQ